MYSIIRFIIVCLFLISSIIVIKRSNITCKRILYIIITSLSVILLVVLEFFPFENLFVNFGSPKAAYEYYSFEKSNIELIVEGDSCDFIIDHKNDKYKYLIIPKTVDGWKIGIGSNTKIIVQKIYNGITMYVYQYKNTNDYYVVILDTNGGKLKISDSYNTIFYSLEKNNDILGESFVTYYAHINYNQDYTIKVNNNSIKLS